MYMLYVVMNLIKCISLYHICCFSALFHAGAHTQVYNDYCEGPENDVRNRIIAPFRSASVAAPGCACHSLSASSCMRRSSCICWCFSCISIALRCTFARQPGTDQTEMQLSLPVSQLAAYSCNDAQEPFVTLECSTRAATIALSLSWRRALWPSCAADHAAGGTRGTLGTARLSSILAGATT